MLGRQILEKINLLQKKNTINILFLKILNEHIQLLYSERQIIYLSKTSTI